MAAWLEDAQAKLISGGRLFRGLKPPAHPEVQRQGQGQRKKQIPGGNDRKKGKGNGKCNNNYRGPSLRSG